MKPIVEDMNEFLYLEMTEEELLAIIVNVGAVVAVYIIREEE